MNRLVGRKKEQAQLKRLMDSDQSEFVALYGRRRVGKTFLVRQFFEDQFSFYVTGVNNAPKSRQLLQFHAELTRNLPRDQTPEPAKDWFTAFQQLIQLLEQEPKESKKVIFLDELPWLDTKNSGFLTELEVFWNSWASARYDIVLIVCGSAAAWMVKNLLNNQGGLHNRITERIKLEPFNLNEVEQFLERKGILYNRYQIVQLYMIFGGIPYYLNRLIPTESAAQNVNRLCFERSAPFRSEYDNLYGSLFSKSERHLEVVQALSSKKRGLTRGEIIELTSLGNGGSLSKVLRELEESSFIRTYRSFGKKSRESVYQLMDAYSLFYLEFIKNISPDDENFWINALESPRFRAWSGYAFERVCLQHVAQIKKALGIAGVQTSVSAWQSKTAQVDLIIDRKDQIINLVEIKYAAAPFSIQKKYAENLRNKLAAFSAATGTRKSLFLTFITTYGLANTKHSGIAQNDLTMDVLFE